MTSDVRREVAAWLRMQVGEEECIDYAVFRIINDVLGVNGAWGAKAAHILADLIDPTCGEWRDDTHPIDPAGFTEDDSGLWCEHCDIPLNPDYRYCPYCGSRVVSDDGE